MTSLSYIQFFSFHIQISLRVYCVKNFAVIDCNLRDYNLNHFPKIETDDKGQWHRVPFLCFEIWFTIVAKGQGRELPILKKGKQGNSNTAARYGFVVCLKAQNKELCQERGLNQWEMHQEDHLRPRAEEPGIEKGIAKRAARSWRKVLWKEVEGTGRSLLNLVEG